MKLLLAIVILIIFGPLKTLPRSSKSCDCVTFGVLGYLLSTFLLCTSYCHMILSKQKCCLLSTGISTESQKRASVLQLGQGFLATGNVTRVDVGLARSCVKLLLSSWKTYMCSLMAWYINRWWGFLWAPIVLHLWQIYFCIVTRGTLCMTFKSRNVLTSWMCLAVPLGVLAVFSPSVALNLRNIFLIYIQLNFSWIKQILQTKRLS